MLIKYDPAIARAYLQQYPAATYQQTCMRLGWQVNLAKSVYRKLTLEGYWQKAGHTHAVIHAAPHAVTPTAPQNAPSVALPPVSGVIASLPAMIASLPAVPPVFQAYLNIYEPPKPETADAPARAGEGDEYEGNTRTITRIVTERIKNDGDLLRVCGIDAGVWKVERWQVKAYEGYTRGADGGPHLTPTMFSVSARLIRRAEAVTLREELAAMIADAKAHAPVYGKVTRKGGGPAPRLLEFSIPDTHFGKLAHAEESGANYDAKIAEEIYRGALLDLMAAAAHYDAERILFVLGSDMLNSDGVNGMTTGGTPQDNDSRYHKTMTAVRTLMVWTIEQLRLIAPVDVVVVPGNHDTLSAWAMGEILAAWFHDAGDVTFDNRSRLRKYYRYGANLLCLTHGDKERPQAKLAGITAAEHAEWSECTHRAAHIGHLHKMSVEEVQGFRVCVLPSLCGADAWHAQHGFTSNIREAQCHVWRRNGGCDILTASVPVPYLALKETSTKGMITQPC